MRTLIGYLVVLILAIPATPTTPPAPPLKAKGSDSLYLFKDNGKWGYLDRNGAIVIPAEFDAAGDFFEGLAPATKGDARGYINTSGRFEILRREEYLGPFRDGLAGVGRNSDVDTAVYTDLIDRQGNSAFDFRFATIRPFSEGLATFGLPAASPSARNYLSLIGKFGFVDRAGVVVIPANYNAVGDFSEGVAPVAVLAGSLPNGIPLMKWGLIDRQGNLVVRIQFDELKTIRYGVSIYWNSPLRRQGLIDKFGRIVLPARYMFIQDFGDGGKVQLFKADSSSEKSDFLRPDGSIAFSLDNVRVNPFSDGLARIEKDEKVGFINDHGVAVIPSEFEDASDFSEGLAAAKKGTWGFIDKQGQWVIAPQFDGAKEFRDGLALVANNPNWHYINKGGLVVRPNVWTYPPCDLDPDLLEMRLTICGY